MKKGRPLRWVFGILLFFLLLLGLLWLPSVQKAIFVSLASGPDREVSVDTFRVRPGGVLIENLEFSGDGLLARVPSLRVSISWSDLFRRRLVLPELTANNLFLRLEETEEGKNDAPEDPVRLPEKFNGLLNQNVPVQIGELSINGVFSSSTLEGIKFSVSGKQIVSGQSGNLTLHLSPEQEDSETVPDLNVSLSMDLTAEAKLSSLQLAGVLTSRSPKAVGSLEIEGRVRSSDLGESYELSIRSKDLLPDGLLSLAGEWNRADKLLSLGLSAKGEDLQFLQPLSAEPLPQVAFQVESSTTLRPGQGLDSGALSFALNAPSGVVPGFDQRLLAEGELEVGRVEEGFSLKELSMSINPEGSEREWFGVRLLKPQVFSENTAFQLDKEQFAEISFFLPSSFLDGQMEGYVFSDLSGAVAVSGNGDGVSIQTTKELSFEVRLKGDNSSGISFLTKPLIQFDGKNISVSGDSIVSSGSDEIRLDYAIDSSAEDWTKIAFSLQSEGELKTLSAILPSDQSAVEGVFALDWKGSWNEGLTAAGEFKINDLQMEKLPTGDLNLAVDEITYSKTEEESFSADFDLLWRANNRVSSISEMEVKASRKDMGRWLVSALGGSIRFDPRSVKLSNGQSQNANKSEPIGIPDPAIFDWLRQPPVFPIDIRKAEFDFELLGEEGEVAGSLAVNDLIPGGEGSFLLSAGSSGEGSVAEMNGVLKGVLRIDSDAKLSRLESSLKLESKKGILGLEGSFVELSFDPDSTMEPLGFKWLSTENGAPLLSGRGSFPKGRANVSIEIDFTTWLRSPLRAVIPNLATGHLKAEVELSDKIDYRINIEALTPLDDFESFEWQSTGSARSLSPLDSSLSMVITDAKGKKSDLALDLSGSLGSAVKFELTGNRVDVEALQGFANVWSRPDEPLTAPDDTVPDPQSTQWPMKSLPFGISGSLSVAMIELPNLPGMKNLDGRVSLGKEEMVVRVSGEWIEKSLFSFESRVSPENGKVKGAVVGKVNTLPLGSLLKEMQPNSTPPMEGLIDVQMDFAGVAVSLEDLPNRLVGNASLQARDGVIRSLRPEARVSRIVEAGSLAGIVFADRLNRPGLAALGEVANLFSKIPFQLLQIDLRRTEKQETLIEKIKLLGPYLYMDGKGRVDSGTLADLSVTPMELTLNLASKPPLSRQLEILGILGANLTADGYREWKEPIRLKGSFAEPDTSDLWGTLISAVERAATMRSRDLEKMDSGEPAPADKDRPSTEQIIEDGVNRLLRRFGN